jgi:hypothetical protein
MGALTLTDSSRFGSLNAIISPALQPRLVSTDVRAREPRPFPAAPTRRELPPMIRDEMLELYAFIFCQGGFRRLGMTFEQFLLVGAAIKPQDFVDVCEGLATH